MICPNCAAPMTAMTLDAHLGTTVTIDLCEPCQLFWFDRYETLKLTTASILKLFTLIGQRTLRGGAPMRGVGLQPRLDDGPKAMSKLLQCPCCGRALVPTHDRQRTTPFEYWRCDAEHGRLMTFFNFLREKDFVRPLSG